MKYVQICLLSSVLFLVGCAGVQQHDCEDVVTLPHLKADDPAPLELSDVSFVVVTEKNSNDVFSKMEKSGIDPVVWGMTDDDYKNMAINMEKLQNYIQQQHDLIEAYRQYYEDKPSRADIGHPE